MSLSEAARVWVEPGVVALGWGPCLSASGSGVVDPSMPGV